MARLVVLASGSGSLFQALTEATIAGVLDAEVVALITDRECAAEDRARQLGIAVRRIEPGEDRETWNHAMAELLNAYEPDLVVSAGFMRVLGPEVVKAWQGRLINTHPALLPQFPGAHAVRDALAAGVDETGASVHFVDAGVDTGAVIDQRHVSILPTDDEETLHERIKQAERDMLVTAVGEFLAGSYRLENAKVVRK